MNLVFDFHASDFVRLLVAVIVGGVIGGEREYPASER
jgi:uncharacterized membrane protein YhiD involved in acid resistance